MSAPTWILAIFAVVMILVAEVSAGQLVIARAWTRRGPGAGVAVSRLLTGIAVAGILVPGLSALPDAVWEVAFALMTAWFAWCLRRESRRTRRRRRGPRPLRCRTWCTARRCSTCSPPWRARRRRAQACPCPERSGMPGMAAASSGGLPALPAPALALAFALLLVALALRDLDRRAGVDGYLGPAVKGCQVATGVVIAFTLIMLI